MTKKDLIEAQLEAITIFEANNIAMTVSECSEFLGCHKDTVRSKIKSGDIIAYNLGGWRIPKMQFHKEIIEEWIVRNQTDGLRFKNLSTLVQVKK